MIFRYAVEYFFRFPNSFTDYLPQKECAGIFAFRRSL